MKNRSVPGPISKTGATITLVTPNAAIDNRCEPCEECRPICEGEVGPDCAPDCTCDPVCEEQGADTVPDSDPFPLGEEQDCEPNT
jgi:hypothetical protein